MRTLDYIRLEEKSTEKVIKELQQLLADYQLYYTNLRGFHWNIKGRSFFQLHETYENLYNDAAEKVDGIAERILMLNGIPPHNFSDYLKTSKIKETGLVDDADKIAHLILDYMKVLIEQERKVMALASENNDEGTSALMSDYIREQEKSVWMLTAYLS